MNEVLVYLLKQWWNQVYVIFGLETFICSFIMPILEFLFMEYSYTVHIYKVVFYLWFNSYVVYVYIHETCMSYLWSFYNWNFIHITNSMFQWILKMSFNWRWFKLYMQQRIECLIHMISLKMNIIVCIKNLYDKVGLLVIKVAKP